MTFHSVGAPTPRHIDRDLRSLDHEEKLLLQKIKARAKTPGFNPATDAALKAQAKKLVGLRKQKEKMYETNAQCSIEQCVQLRVRFWR